jgi:Na+/proline symporter
MTVNASTLVDEGEGIVSEELIEYDPDVQSSNLLLYIFMITYLAILVVVGYTAYQRKRRAEQASTLSGHFGGTFSPVVLALTTFSSTFSGYTVIGVPQEASLKGFFSLRWLPAILVIVSGMLIFYPRLRRLKEERGYQSPNDFLTDRFRSKWLTLLGSLCTCFPQLLYLTVQIVSFADLLRGVTYELIPKLVGMFIFAIIILCMEKIGGMNSVVLSDAVQAALMIVGFIAMLCSLLYYYGTLESFSHAECGSLGFVNASDVLALASAGRNNTAPDTL